MVLVVLFPAAGGLRYQSDYLGFDFRGGSMRISIDSKII